MSKCLYCYKELEPGEVDFHKSCCKKFFGTPTAPSLDYTRAQMDELAAQVIRSQTDRKSTRLNSSHIEESRMPSSA